MAKAVKTQVKLLVKGGEATPAPPIGPSLAQHGINIAQFCQQFNAATQDQRGSVVPVVITVFDDRSFEFELKKPPVSEMLKKAAGAEKGSGQPHTNFVATLSADQIRKIAEDKLSELNTTDVEQAMKIVAGTARSMGIKVTA